MNKYLSRSCSLSWRIFHFQCSSQIFSLFDFYILWKSLVFKNGWRDREGDTNLFFSELFIYLSKFLFSYIKGAFRIFWSIGIETVKRVLREQKGQLRNNFFSFSNFLKLKKKGINLIKCFRWIINIYGASSFFVKILPRITELNDAVTTGILFGMYVLH